MGEIRYMIIAKQCEVAGKSLILDGCHKKTIFIDTHLVSQFSLQPNTFLLYSCHGIYRVIYVDFN